MTAIDITCRPGDGILRTSADTVAALDSLAEQLTSQLEHIADTVPVGTPWEIDLRVGRTPADTVVLTVRPATTNESEEDYQ